MAFLRRVNYYETDKMQCTHHSNYVRFMEEARVDFLDKFGYSFSKMEADGLISPVLSISLDYKRPTTFDDVIEIEVRLKSMTLARMEFEYVMKCKGEVVCQASSAHCYLDKSGRPISLKKVNPALYERFAALIK